MYFLVLSREEILGTVRLEVVDHHFSYAAGIFEPSPAFRQVQPLFEQAPDALYWADLFADLDAHDDAIKSFCQARDTLQLHMRRSDGVYLSIRVVTIQYDEQQQHWKVLVHADQETHFHLMVQPLYADAAELFTRYTRPWPAAGEVAIAHLAEIARAMEIMGRKTKQNPILIGEPGEARRSLLAEIVLSLQQGAVSERAGWHIAELDGDRLYPSQIPDQAMHTLSAVIWYASQQSPRTVFIIEHFDRMARWAAPLLKPFLARGQLCLIGTATLADYRQYIERDAAIQRRMQEIIVND